MSKYTEKDAAKETGVSIKETYANWHQAHDDAVKAGELPERNSNKISDSEHSSFLDSVFKFIRG